MMSTTPDIAVTAPPRVVDAITMPAGLGARVQAQLAIAMLAGPVLLHTDGQRWIFLVEPDAAFRSDLGADLTERGVRHETVPATGHAGWITPPRRDETPPSIYTVVATARRVCA